VKLIFPATAILRICHFNFFYPFQDRILSLIAAAPFLTHDPWRGSWSTFCVRAGFCHQPVAHLFNPGNFGVFVRFVRSKTLDKAYGGWYGPSPVDDLSL
jgi:hypothetical protein